jgi:hypothetical protein
MLEVCKISKLTRSSGGLPLHISVLSLHYDLQSTSDKLFVHDCGECAGPTNLENILENVFTDNATQNITFKQWILTDRRESVTTVKSDEKFTESLLEKL